MDWSHALEMVLVACLTAVCYGSWLTQEAQKQQISTTDK